MTDDGRTSWSAEASRIRQRNKRRRDAAADDRAAEQAAEHDPYDPLGWRLEGACRHMDTALFVPAKEDREDVAEAKAVCNGSLFAPECPVREECMAFAIPRPALSGVWGGTTQSERRRLRGARQAVTG